MTINRTDHLSNGKWRIQGELDDDIGIPTQNYTTLTWCDYDMPCRATYSLISIFSSLKLFADSKFCTHSTEYIQKYIFNVNICSIWIRTTANRADWLLSENWKLIVFLWNCSPFSNKKNNVTETSSMPMLRPTQIKFRLRVFRTMRRSGTDIDQMESHNTEINFIKFTIFHWFWCVERDTWKKLCFLADTHCLQRI